jgi:hypothetical protein
MKRLMLPIVRTIACTLVLLGVAVSSTAQERESVTHHEKEVFLRLLKSLPTDADGEFYTDEAINLAAPHINVLFALTNEDISKYDIYPFLALSRGLCDQQKYREYGARHFRDIRHPIIKLFWGAVLFDVGTVTPEIVEYLRAALKSPERAKTLSEMIGPDYEKFKKRVLDYRNEPK